MTQKHLTRLMAGSTLLMAAAALTVAGIYVKNELRPSGNAYSFGDPQYVEGWEADLESGFRSGPSEAPAKLLQFVDFQCPFCRRQAGFVAELRQEYGEALEIVTFHLPLTEVHRFALMTAVAAECGDLQDRFEEVENALYVNQDSIGLKSWRVLAGEAGVPEPDEFAACVEENETMPRIEAGIELAARMDARSTPTVLINGWRFPASPNLERQRAAIDAVLRGEPPMEGDSLTLR